MSETTVIGGDMTGDERRRVLADGNVIPTLGLGVWQVPDGPQCENAVRWALEFGYRHIDTAQAYGNEASVGRALRDSGIPRGEVFITTKFHPGRRDPAAEAEGSLRRLGVDQVDLYIVHWPQKGPTWAWPGMEAAQEHGYTRSIGVSNYSVDQLDEVMSVASSARRQPGPVQPLRVSPRAAGGMRGARGRARGLQPARDRPSSLRPRGRADRRAGAADAGAGPDSLVPAAGVFQTCTLVGDAIPAS
ncbi:MAG TPA: aldo/keto reductase [Solirubrobacteraceae bacterium]|nr:aldo/keto reductase [Solirubrobacteraceae bacterium]